MFKQYQYDKYEKIEFDLNSIDSNLMKSKLVPRIGIYISKTWIPPGSRERPTCPFS